MKLGLNNRGQGLVEYLILVCLIAVSAIGIVSLVGTNIKEQYSNVSRALDGKSSEKKKLTTPQEDLYQGRGMDDYLDSAKKAGW